MEKLILTAFLVGFMTFNAQAAQCPEDSFPALFCEAQNLPQDHMLAVQLVKESVLLCETPAGDFTMVIDGEVDQAVAVVKILRMGGTQYVYTSSEIKLILSRALVNRGEIIEEFSIVLPKVSERISRSLTCR